MSPMNPSASAVDSAEALLDVENLVVRFPIKGGLHVNAVSDISFEVYPGETLGILGESGCGKSSAGRALMQIPSPTGGVVRLLGKELQNLSKSELREYRSPMQMIFQDPVSSLNPRRKVKDLVAEGPTIQGQRVSEDAIRQVLSEVGLDPDVVWDRRPHELSGGQCQRVSIARALMLQPRLIICDEPVSSLDVSVQAQILNLLEESKEKHNLSLIFIAHDLAVVKNISDRIMVMYLGKICEIIPASNLTSQSMHPYTHLLLSSVPDMEESLTGTSITESESNEMPSPINPPSGCRFRTRCPFAQERCASEEPEMRDLGRGHKVACHFYEEIRDFRESTER